VVDTVRHAHGNNLLDRARIALAADGEGYVLVEVVGELDIATRPELSGVLATAVDSGRSAVIVDLTAVTLLAAAEFGCLQQAANQLAERDRHLHLVCPADGRAARVVQLLGGPDRDWPLHQDMPTAIATVKSQA
jgi:anti-sigma B factor antagonist